MVPGRDLGALLQARQVEEQGEGLRVLVEHVDFEEGAEEDEGGYVDAEEEREGRGRSMMKVDSRERTEALTPRG